MNSEQIEITLHYSDLTVAGTLFVTREAYADMMDGRYVYSANESGEVFRIFAARVTKDSLRSFIYIREPIDEETSAAWLEAI